MFPVSHHPDRYSLRKHSSEFQNHPFRTFCFEDRLILWVNVDDCVFFAHIFFLPLDHSDGHVMDAASEQDCADPAVLGGFQPLREKKIIESLDQETTPQFRDEFISSHMTQSSAYVELLCESADGAEWRVIGLERLDIDSSQDNDALLVNPVCFSEIGALECMLVCELEDTLFAQVNVG